MQPPEIHNWGIYMWSDVARSPECIPLNVIKIGPILFEIFKKKQTLTIFCCWFLCGCTEISTGCSVRISCASAVHLLPAWWPEAPVLVGHSSTGQCSAWPRGNLITYVVHTPYYYQLSVHLDLNCGVGKWVGGNLHIFMSRNLHCWVQSAIYLIFPILFYKHDAAP